MTRHQRAIEEIIDIVLRDNPSTDVDELRADLVRCNAVEVQQTLAAFKMD